MPIGGFCLITRGSKLFALIRKKRKICKQIVVKYVPQRLKKIIN